MRHRHLGRGLLGLLLAAGAVACRSDDEGAPVPATDATDATDVTDATDGPDGTEATGGTLPPPGADDLEPIYGAALADLGLVLTDRGGLIDRSGGGYAPSASGTHLALYVEPIGSRRVPEYIEGIRSVGVVFADVFTRWPGLVSYDVCQEPTSAEDDGAEPLPVTQIELTRAEAAAIDWATVTAADLVRSSRADPPGLALRVSTALAQDPAFTALVEG